MYVITARAKVHPNVRWIEPVNEWFIFNIYTSLMLFTDFISDEKTKQQLAQYLIYYIGSMGLINLLFILYEVAVVIFLRVK